MAFVDSVRNLFNRNRPAAIWGGAFALAFLLSLALFLALADGRFKVVLFFPVNISHKLSGEQRIVPRARNLDDNIETVVNGLILGPAELKFDRVVPAATKIRALMVKGSTAYLDFTPAILFPSEDVALPFEEALAAMRKSILFNFHTIRRVVFTVDGREPSSEFSANN